MSTLEYNRPRQHSPLQQLPTTVSDPSQSTLTSGESTIGADSCDDHHLTHGQNDSSLAATRDSRRRSLVSLPPGQAPETIIQFSDHTPALDLVSYVVSPRLINTPPSPPEHRSQLHQTDTGSSIERTSPRRPSQELERERTLFNRLSSISLGFGSSSRSKSGNSSSGTRTPVIEGLGPSAHDVFRQSSKDSSKTLTTAPQVIDYSTIDDHLYPDLHVQIPPTPPPPPPPGLSAKDGIVSYNNGARRPSSPFLLQTLSPNSPPPPVLLSPTGKRYVDTRKRNKKLRQGRKDAFKSAKTMFSNERTFIHWIKFGMLLGALAMLLLNFSGQASVSHTVKDRDLVISAGMIGQRVGMALLAICLLSLIYAAFTYHWRHIGVAAGTTDEKRYFDRVGPTILTFGLLVTYGINMILTILITSKIDPSYTPPNMYNVHNTDSLEPSPTSAIGGGIVGVVAPPIPPAIHSLVTPLPPPAFDAPRLPLGATIMISGADEEEEEIEENIRNESSSTEPSAEEEEPLTESAVSRSRDGDSLSTSSSEDNDDTRASEDDDE
ncbi:hypothetical protein BG004_000686 [Podila humilis]|nr:hypothetical protein BG004_000686 [Podila humilis]